jgi:hypothetical protein
MRAFGRKDGQIWRSKQSLFAIARKLLTRLYSPINLQYCISCFFSAIWAFFCLIHLSGVSISISFSCISFSVTLIFLLPSHVLPFFSVSFYPCAVHSLSTIFHLEAMYSQFVFQLNKMYVLDSFILLCRSASDVVERPGSITDTFECFSTCYRPRTFFNTFRPCWWISHLATQRVSPKLRSENFTNDLPHLVSR